MKLLKNILLISLLFGLTVPKDVLHFMVHIPVYLHHFHHHNAAQEPMGLAEFINEHSSDSDHHGKEHHHHDKLPFSHHHSCDCNQSQTFIPFYTRQIINFHLPAIAHQKIIVQQFFCSSEFVPSIWQPPKMS